MNTLFYGDCLTIMREKMNRQSVDLVYLDPPFNSNEDYNGSVSNSVEIHTSRYGLSTRATVAIKPVLE